MRATTPCRFAAVTLAAVLWYAPVRAAPPAQPAGSVPAVAAVWAHRSLQFTYRGMTARYTCRGLQGEIEDLLTRLGARDLKVEECAVRDRVIPFPSVRVTMQVLVPAAHGTGGPTVKARWRKVMLFPSMRGSGSCELISEFRRTFLPLFEARNVDMSAACVPYHHVPGNHLYAEVLTADPSGASIR